MIVREASERDIPAIARIHVDTWRTAYRGIFPDKTPASLSYEKREQGWRQVWGEAKQNNSFTLVAESDSGEIIGFANGGAERTGDLAYKGELNAIYILDSYQRQGIGCALVRGVALKLAQMDIHSMLVWVLADNSACRFYERLGGEAVHAKQIERQGIELLEIAYGWADTSHLQRIRRSQ